MWVYLVQSGKDLTRAQDASISQRGSSMDRCYLDSNRTSCLGPQSITSQNLERGFPSHTSHFLEIYLHTWLTLSVEPQLVQEW